MWEDEVKLWGLVKGTQSWEQNNKTRQNGVSKKELSSESDDLRCILLRVFTLSMDMNI